MPQLYTQQMYGSYFSPNPGINIPNSSFKDSRNAKKSEFFYAQGNDTYEDVHLQKVLGAKTDPYYMQTSALDPSFGFPFTSPPLTQAPPVIYTPQKNRTNHENLPYQSQNWSPDVNRAARQSPITASRLSFNESYSPSNTTVDDTVQESSFWEEDEPSFLDNPNFRSGQVPHPGLGIICNKTPHTIPLQTFKEEELFENEQTNNDIELFLKEDPFAEAVQTEDWLSDSQQYDHHPHAPFEEVNTEIISMRQITNKGRQSPKKESPIIKQEGCANSEKPTPYTPRKLRKAKSFGYVGKYSLSTNFSLENCLNEFHVKEGKYLFQDETARVLKQLGSPSISRRKSAPKLAGSTNSLKKGKTSSNLYLRAGLRPNEGTLKDMESRLGLFKVQLKSATPSDINEIIFPQEPVKSEYAHSWKDFS